MDNDEKRLTAELCKDHAEKAQAHNDSALWAIASVLCEIRDRMTVLDEESELEGRLKKAVAGIR